MRFGEDDLRFRDPEELIDHLYALEGIEVRHIGYSRDHMEMHGIRFGEGPDTVSVIAGCHADEPIGPMTAQILARVLRRDFPELLDRFTFVVVPQMNPDGAQRNSAWFGNPLDVAAYLNHAVRELPGDDLEFGFGKGPGIRPECTSAQEFLGKHGPYAAHFSLHGMAFAEGAWCLIAKEWVERSSTYIEAFIEVCRALDFPLHDVERNGEKGFSRIQPGFCTTPTAVAMRAFFRAQNDAVTAYKFTNSSMEWISALGGDPLCIVSEIPLFLVGRRSPSLDEPIGPQLREKLTALRASGAEIDLGAVSPLLSEYGIGPTALDLQVRLQVAMIVLSLAHAPIGVSGTG